MRSADLSEAAWARIEPLMPQAEGRSRPWRDHRQVVEGIVFRYRTGVAWRDLPEGFGDTAYSSRAIRAHLRARGIGSVIPEPDDQKARRRRRGSSGGRPV